MTKNQIPLWEVFIRPRNGLAHKHCGSVHAADEVMALQAARDVYTRRGEGTSIWVVPSSAITASDPETRTRISSPRFPRSTVTRPSTTFPKMWGTCDGSRVFPLS